VFFDRAHAELSVDLFATSEMVAVHSPATGAVPRAARHLVGRAAVRRRTAKRADRLHPHRLADPPPDRAIYLVTSKRAANTAAGLELLRAGLQATADEFDVQLAAKL
jgi:hypothetical protein